MSAIIEALKSQIESNSARAPIPCFVLTNIGPCLDETAEEVIIGCLSTLQINVRPAQIKIEQFGRSRQGQKPKFVKFQLAMGADQVDKKLSDCPLSIRWGDRVHRLDYWKDRSVHFAEPNPLNSLGLLTCGTKECGRTHALMRMTICSTCCSENNGWSPQDGKIVSAESFCAALCCPVCLEKYHVHHSTVGAVRALDEQITYEKVEESIKKSDSMKTYLNRFALKDIHQEKIIQKSVPNQIRKRSLDERSQLEAVEEKRWHAIRTGEEKEGPSELGTVIVEQLATKQELEPRRKEMQLELLSELRDEQSRIAQLKSDYMEISASLLKTDSAVHSQILCRRSMEINEEIVVCAEKIARAAREVAQSEV